MLRDITLGQYYPADSVIHKLDPRVKLFATMIYIIALFTFQGILGFAPEPLVLCGFRARNIDKYNKIIAKCQHLFFDFSIFFNRGFSLLFRPQDTVEDEACILKFIAAGGERHHPVLCPG